MEEHYKTYEFKTPDEHPFPKGMKILYIPPKMPGFVGPMPQLVLTEGTDYLVVDSVPDFEQATELNDVGIRRNGLPVLINAPLHTDRRSMLTEHLIREIRENHNEPVFITCESIGSAMNLFDGMRGNLKERGQLLIDPLQFDLDKMALLSDVKEDHFTPRNRRERRQGKQLDSKHKGRGEWWNR